MFRIRPPRRSTPALVAGVLVILILAACAGAGGASIGPLDGGEQGAPAPAVPSEAPADESGGGGGDRAPDAIVAQRQIIKTGTISIEVPSVAGALGDVRALAVTLGGYIGGSQAGTLDDSATLTLRVPADRFDEAMERLQELDGTVKSQATREEDVTGAIVDLQARIDNLKASESQYRALLSRAEKIEDILAVQSRLDDVRGQIEQLTGQLQQVQGQADLATLTVTLLPKPQPVQQASSGWDPGEVAGKALGALVEIGQGIVNVAIWVGIVWLPILLVLAVVLVILVRGALEVRRRLPVVPAVRTEPKAE